MQNNQNNPSGYNLEEEKLFIKEVRTLIKEEIRDNRARKLKNFPLFPKIVASLPKVTRIFLLSFDRVYSYNVMAKTYSLSQEQRDRLPHIVWEVAFQNNWDALSQNISIGISVPKEVCQHIARSFLKDMQSFFYIQKMKQAKTQNEIDNRKTLISLSLKKAIEKYPRIMNQRITNSDIVFRGSDGVVTPTVKNWITAYHQEMGSGSHEPFERSQFLFHNKNAVMLSQPERSVLSEILRSLDEESELPIHIGTQEIDLSTIEKSFYQKPQHSMTDSEPKFSQTSQSENRFISKEKIHNETMLHRNYTVNTVFPSTKDSLPQKKVLPTTSTPSPTERRTSPLTKEVSFAYHSKQPKLLEKPNSFSLSLPSKSSSASPSKTSIQPSDTSASFLKTSPQSFSPMHIRDFPQEHPQKTFSKTSFSPKQNRHLDYTDYYPIPNTPKHTAKNIRNIPSFSSSHTFPVEKREKESPIQKNSTSTPLHSQSLPAQKSFPSRQTSPHQNHPTPPTSTPTQLNEKMPQQKTSKQKEPAKKRFLIG